MAQFTHVITQTVNCPAYGNEWVVKNGKQNRQQRYKCRKKFRANEVAGHYLGGSILAWRS